MLTNLRLHNFKAFENVEIKPRKLTLFMGPNNSGKSSILASLRILLQTIESFDADTPLLLNGKMGDFGTYKDIIFSNHRGKPLEISVTIDRRMPHMPPKAQKQVQMELKYKYHTKKRMILLNGTRYYVGKQNILSTEYNSDTAEHEISCIFDKAIDADKRRIFTKTLSMNNFLPFIHPYVLNDSERKLIDDVIYRFRFSSYMHNLRSFFKEMEFLSATRTPPARTYLQTGERHYRVGATGENAANILLMDSFRTTSNKIANKVSAWLRKAEIAENVFISNISDRHYEIRLTHPVTKEDENIADVGFGNSQVFPVLIGGYALSKGSTYMVEEPEIHLHPKAQSVLGDFLLDLYNNDIQCLIETHSEYLILRLQQLIAQGDIKKDDFCVYYVYPKSAKGKVIVKLEVDAAGKFIEEWPEGFFPQRLDQARKLSQIRNSKRQGDNAK